MSTSCDHCLSSSKKCILSENFKNCSECVLLKHACSFSFISFNHELFNFLQNFERVERDCKAAVAEAQEALAHAACLKKQSEFLQKCSDQLLCCETETLELESEA